MDPRDFPGVELMGNDNWLDIVLSPGMETIPLKNQCVEIKFQPHY